MSKRLKDDLETLSKWRTVIQNLPETVAPTPKVDPVGELVKAAEELVRYMNNSTGIHRVDEYMPLIENLSTALEKVK